MTLSAGTKLGPYEIAAPIGAGGMGEVYRAKDPRLGREVAIKVLPSTFSQDTDRLKRFEQEARAAGVLNHPNITAVYDLGTHDGAPYIVTELLEGETLRSRLGSGALSVRKAIDYAIQIARGLAAAHEKGIVHRDLKPENLFLTRDGRVKILDFGLAKLKTEKDGETQTDLRTVSGTEPGVVLGTMGYMSPEQVRGKAADRRSDLFSFGAIFYEMLSGQRAFRGDTAADTITAILTKEPPDLSQTNKDIHPGLDRILRHCLEKNPEERFESARDVAFDLEAPLRRFGLEIRRRRGSGGRAAPRPAPSPRGSAGRSPRLNGRGVLRRQESGIRPSALLPPAHFSPGAGRFGAVRAGRANGPVFGELGRETDRDLHHEARQPRVAPVRTAGSRIALRRPLGGDGGFARPARFDPLHEKRHARPARHDGRRIAEGNSRGHSVFGLEPGWPDPGGRAQPRWEGPARVPRRESAL
jgi:hypothetical protein